MKISGNGLIRLLSECIQGDVDTEIDNANVKTDNGSAAGEGDSARLSLL
ncbi:hypothetical protein [Pokkaliibacter plantistimulans]|nr:hypothetical protein [Pokkaliibacter plantistimulans]